MSIIFFSVVASVLAVRNAGDGLGMSSVPRDTEAERRLHMRLCHSASRWLGVRETNPTFIFAHLPLLPGVS